MIRIREPERLGNRAVRPLELLWRGPRAQDVGGRGRADSHSTDLSPRNRPQLQETVAAARGLLTVSLAIARYGVDIAADAIRCAWAQLPPRVAPPKAAAGS